MLAAVFWAVLLAAGGALVLSLGGTIWALRRRRLLRAGMTAGASLPVLALFGLLLAILLGIEGYKALTREELAAVVRTRPTGEQSFVAHVLFPDGDEARYALRGDELYLDARILKWKYWSHFLGLHTIYELDRIAGRYRALEHERNRPRTVYTLATDRPIDLFQLRRRFPQLSPLLDAEYGSATFVSSDKPATYEIRVSTTGLLARRIDDPNP